MRNKVLVTAAQESVIHECHHSWARLIREDGMNAFVYLIPGAIAITGSLIAAYLAGGEHITSIAVALASGVIVAGAVYGLVRQHLLIPIANLCTLFGHLTRSGNLAERAFEGAGPVGECGRQFNLFISTFQGIIGKVIFDAQRVASTAETLGAHAAQTAAGSSQQRIASNHLTTAIDQMIESVKIMAGHAESTSENAQEAHRLSREGTQIVTEASAAISRTNQSVAESARVITELGQRTETISGIIKVIREIADQTNLLALNAAIEAARAGEQGRGFAVVADEVRKLAERTSSATNEIGEMIKAIQLEARAAVEATIQGRDQASAGAELADKAAESLSRIDLGAQETMVKVDSIASAVMEQGREADKVKGHVQDIMAMVERNSEGASQTLSEAERLNSLAANLHEISNVFLLGPAGEAAMQIHQRMPDLVTSAAKEAGRLLEQAVASGQISEEKLFEREYRPIPNTRPQKYSSSFDSLTDKIMPALQERILANDQALVLACLVDENGYLPTHNKRYNQPLTGDYDTDLVNNRSKRIFDDPVGKRCGAHQLPFLVQTYRRDTGEVMHDISAPVFVNGRQWGGFRIGYRA